jgi:hypothetical protein
MKRTAIKILLSAVVPMSVLILAPRDARAWWNMSLHHTYPAVACDDPYGQLSIYAGTFVNNTTGTIPMSCPLPVEGDAGTIFGLIAAFVSPGFTPSNCWLVSTARDGSYTQVFPGLIPYGSYDQLEWHWLSVPQTYQAALECNLPSGQKFNGYYQNLPIIDWEEL